MALHCHARVWAGSLGQLRRQRPFTGRWPRGTPTASMSSHAAPTRPYGTPGMTRSLAGGAPGGHAAARSSAHPASSRTSPRGWTCPVGPTIAFCGIPRGMTDIDEAGNTWGRLRSWRGRSPSCGRLNASTCSLRWLIPPWAMTGGIRRWATQISAGGVSGRARRSDPIGRRARQAHGCARRGSGRLSVSGLLRNCWSDRGPFGLG